MMTGVQKAKAHRAEKLNKITVALFLCWLVMVAGLFVMGRWS